MSVFKHLRFLAALSILLSIAVAAESPLEKLSPGQSLEGFKVANLYDNSVGKAMGARFISNKYGFIVDLLQIQSVPQAFFWVKSAPKWDKGEPHTCEHLLLGKGNLGRYVSALEDMALGNSSAYTQQLRTCYHFHTTAGEETFYQIFEAKLKALLHPDFTDEEIRREVCHIGVVENEDGSYSLDEKGTVYTEMVSAFEKPWYYHFRVMDEMLYGPDHPVANIAGGDPDDIRAMTAQDMREFIKENYHLSNMGVIVSIPSDIPLDLFLREMSKILENCQNFPDSSAYPNISGYDFPAPQKTEPVGAIKVINCPGKPKEPGHMLFSWPADLEYDNSEAFLLDLFLETFAGGPTSNLYDYFISSEKRKIDIGGSSVSAYSSSDPGHPIAFYLAGVNPEHVTEKMLDSVRSIIMSEAARIYNFADNSDSLLAFNSRVKSRMSQRKRNIEDYLNTPPMFGFRSGPSGRWVSHLEFIEKEPGFRKSLVLKENFALADSLLAGNANFWKKYIERWRLMTVKPFAVGSLPSEEILAKEAEAKKDRISGYVEDFKKKYGVADEQAAILKYKEEFDRNTAELQALEASANLPKFIENPPMTLDDQLSYETIMLPGNVPLVASTFENMTSATVGLAMRLDVIPEAQLVYIPYLPTVLTEIGVIENGKVVKFDEMKERQRQEILRLNAGFDINHLTGRVELQLTGSGGNFRELQDALKWMELSLYSPYLSRDNLPRMLDVIDQNLMSYRNAMKSSEENWVNYPAYAYRYQHNPLIMSADCFLTKIHHLHRLRWLLTDPGTEKDRQDFAALLDSLAHYGKDKSRDDLKKMLTSLEQKEKSLIYGGTLSIVLNGSEHLRDISAVILKNLTASLIDIPDATLARDWDYLCREIRSDLLTDPQVTLDALQSVLASLQKTDNTRMYMISNSADRRAGMEKLNLLVSRLDRAGRSVRQSYAETPRVINRLKEREQLSGKPLYVGLVNDNTRNGVIIFSSKIADVYDTSSESVLNLLAAKFYSGGGGHSFFMKTWGAGLAYSNGVSCSERSGRVGYYAERCPDIAETMRFVVNLLEPPEDNPHIAEYCIAQVFNGSRAASTYESRGMAMAADLADGYTPERMRKFREKVLELRNDPDLFTKLKARLDKVYGPVLVGYGIPSGDAPDGSFFILGPEPQFASMENLIKASEGEHKIYRLYPRDFWLMI